jgi:hypothetical protein
VRSKETENGLQSIAPCDANADALQCTGLDANASRRRRDMLATVHTWVLLWSVTLLLMLEDDVAMIAFMFC